ncbi:hypothetical protein [Spirosoma linguale]|uniref:Uncharacterized protein n=1 Tax=Spirosoma linguale (strain ATCC 33905 / DSM 74 / LMG 10896 / Claus 1) TaxID=504472 RepID=D2QG39_SPILD|nr:hypothetical protein Slin_0582 [Spirosoma linguale DSM 74]
MTQRRTNCFLVVLCLTLLLANPAGAQSPGSLFEQASLNGRLANSGFRRCALYLNGWLAEADSGTGLIPRNLTDSRHFWNAYDAAADNYPFMVMTASLLRPDLFKGTMQTMLQTEQRLTSRIGRLPDTYSFTKKGFLKEPVDSSQVIFGSAEYMKDGLVPLTEWLGPNTPWFRRMEGILDDLLPVVSLPIHLTGNFYGNSADVEVNGDLLQVLNRMYWITRKQKYLDVAVALGDHYLNDKRLLTQASTRLRMRDHGCEIIAGLSEVYATMHLLNPAKKKQWQPYMTELLDLILTKGRNADGLFYNEINPSMGTILDPALADTWGYLLNACYTVYLTDGRTDYRDAVIKALQSLNQNYRNYAWEGQSSDGYADSIEGALNLILREKSPSAAQWIDSEMQVMWAKQKPSGIIEGWHGDGNFARTTLMYCLWKTAGTWLSNWQESVTIGAVPTETGLYISAEAAEAWSGSLRFSPAFHQVFMRLPINYPRINQFQEWYPVDGRKTYTITNTKTQKTVTVTGRALLTGYPIRLTKGETMHLLVRER